MLREIRIGLIGYKFMGKAHSHAFRNVPRFFNPKLSPIMVVVCGRNEKAVIEAQHNLGWQEHETHWENVIDREDIDIVDICTPVSTHKSIAMAAAAKSKHVLCEKPLAMNSREASEMLEVAERRGIKHMVGFNYRRVPAVKLAKQIIQEKRIGKIYHFHARYLQDWLVDPHFPLTWQLRKEIAGNGVSSDLGSHIIDLARYLVGEIERVAGVKKIFTKYRPLIKEAENLQEEQRKGEVTVDDATLFLAEFKNGCIASFETSRYSTGRKNYEYIEMNGSGGSLIFNFERMNELKFFSRKDPLHIQGFRNILVTEKVHPYMEAWWPSGLVIGYDHTFVNQAYDLLECIFEDKQPEPNFLDGLRVHLVIDAVHESIAKGRWVKVREV